MKKLYIIDGSAYLYRAYYGLPPMYGPEWELENVNAIFGFFKMILKLFQEQPDYFVIAWDAPQKTIRHEMFTEYKSNRASSPEDFKPQVKVAKQLAAQIGIPALEIPGYEADDLIATVATIAEKDDTIHSFIYSSDKDLKQMLTNTCTFKDPMKGTETTPGDFRVEYGFDPQQIVDYLSLLWDASDNIPGVRWIGKKWAQKLIKEYGDLDGIYENIESIKGATKQKLLDGKDSAYYSKKLIVLHDVPGVIDAGLDDYTYTLNFDEMNKQFIKHYDFKSMQKNLDALHKQLNTPQMISLF